MDTVVGLRGGVASDATGGATVEILPGAVPDGTIISIVLESNAPPGNVGRAWRIEPDGITLVMPAIVKLAYRQGDLGGTSPSDLRVAFVENGRWKAVTWVGHDPAARTVSGQTMHLSIWGLIDARASGSSSSGGVAPSTQLEGLCPILASGYLNDDISVAQQIYGRPGCPYFAVSDEEVYEFLHGDHTTHLNALCDPAGGPIAQMVSQIATSQAAGRLIYDPAAAARCLEAGFVVRGPTDGGLMELLATLPDGGVAPLRVVARNNSDCAGMILGLVGAGEPCNHSLECAEGTTGADCMTSMDAGCQRICVPRSGPGARCVSDRVGCQAGLTCVAGADYRVGTCEAPRANLASCVIGYNRIPCQPGLFCNSFTGAGSWDDLCHYPFIQGQACERSAQCSEGLFCDSSSSGGVCAPTLAVDALCAEDEDCGPCLFCVSRDGATRCTSRVGEGASCTDAVCLGGLECLDGECVRRGRTGEPCVVDVPGTPAWQLPELRGSCLDVDDACVGTPATCQPRALAGEPCTSRAVSTSEQGSCIARHYCLRSATAESVGVCHPAGLPGRPCGNTPDLPTGCQSVGAADPRCIAFDGGISRCLWVYDAPIGTECHDDGRSLNPTCTPGHCMDGICTLDAGSAMPPGYVGVGGTCSDYSTPRCWDSWCYVESFFDGICRAYTQPGEQCSMVGGMFGSFDPCDRSTLCRSVGDGGSMCVERYAEGALCAPGECRDGLRCIVVDGGVRRCSPLAAAGAPCASGECVDGHYCYAGICEPRACLAPPPVAANDDIRWWLFITGIVPLALWMRRFRR